jgi:NagD protein
VVRMDTDILAGTEARITPVLVLTGVTKREQVKRFAYQPYVVLNSIVDIVPPKNTK